MPRSGGSYTAPSSSFNPAVEGTEVDDTDWNSLLDDIESALTESVYSGGLGSSDNRLLRSDGTDGKKIQGSAVTLDDSSNLSGVAALSATTIELGHASDTTIARSGAGDISIEGNAVYRTGGTDVAVADGGTGASTAAAGFRALAEGVGSTQGQLLYRSASQWTALSPGSSGQVLTSGGAGADPAWTATGSGDVTAAANFGTDNRVLRSDGAAKGAQASGLTLDDSANLSGIAALSATTIELGHASDTTIARSGAGDISIEGNAIYRAGGTDVTVADGGTGASTAAAGFRALAEGVGSTQGQVLYRDASQWAALSPGSAGQVLTSGGAAANPSWTTVTGTGDVTAAANFGTDNRLLRSDGTAKGAQASGLTVDDSANLSGLPSVNGGPLAGLRNRLINGCMRINQRAATSNADDTYAFDRWNILTQTGAVAVSQLTDVENTTPYMMRITQSQASAQRFGVEQIIEAVNCKDLRGQSVTLSARVRCSNSTTLRYAVLEWTGTADSVTSDFVNDWTNGTFTAGQFFTSTSTTVTGTGSTALTANTLATVSLSVTVGNSANNLIVIFWTDSTQAQNSTLDLGKVQLEIGSTATSFEHRQHSFEMTLCQRYFEIIAPGVTGTVVGSGGFESTTRLVACVFFQNEKRSNAARSVSSAADFKCRRVNGGTMIDCSSISFGSGNTLNTGMFDANVGSSFGAGCEGEIGYFMTATTSAKLLMDAEL
jgi:hypothetical protein